MATELSPSMATSSPHQRLTGPPLPLQIQNVYGTISGYEGVKILNLR